MSEIVIYQTPDNQTQVDVQFEGETFWLTQEQISQLFERDRTVITRHLRGMCKFCTHHKTRSHQRKNTEKTS